MSLTEIKSLFPLTVEVTQEIIDKANPFNPYDCIGNHTLKSVLGSQVSIMWTSIDGEIRIPGGKVFIKTRGKVSMMDIEKPRSVTFELI